MKILRPICVLFLSLLAVTASYLCGITPVAKAEDALTEASGKWLLGVWRGTQHRGGLGLFGDVSVEFKEEDRGIAWRMESRASGGPKGGGRRVARGWATVSGDSVTMKGRYGNGEPLSYSLTRHDDTLEGSGVGGNVRLDDVSWKKAK